MGKTTEQDLLEIAGGWAKEFQDYKIFEPMYRALEQSYSGRLQPTEKLLKILEEELVTASAANRIPVNCQQFEKLVTSMNIPGSPEHVLSTIATYDTLKPCDVMRAEITDLVEEDIKEFNADFKVMADYAIGIINNRHNQRFSRITILIAVVAILANCIIGYASYNKKSDSCCPNHSVLRPNNPK